MPIWSEILAELANGQPPNFDGVRRSYLVALHRHTGRNLILYASGWLQRESPPGLVSIGDEDMQAFMEVSQGLESDRLDLILHSPGGSPKAAEAIVSYLRFDGNVGRQDRREPYRPRVHQAAHRSTGPVRPARCRSDSSGRT